MEFGQLHRSAAVMGAGSDLRARRGSPSGFLPCARDGVVFRARSENRRTHPGRATLDIKMRPMTIDVSSAGRQHA
jgi:hypothetical protein